MGFFSTFLRRTFGPKRTSMKLKQGDRAPDFDVVDQNGQRVKLSDFKGKRVVLWFYPKADTPG
jgi:peroxiredoxin Q/BCP